MMGVEKRERVCVRASASAVYFHIKLRSAMESGESGTGSSFGHSVEITSQSDPGPADTRVERFLSFTRDEGIEETIPVQTVAESSTVEEASGDLSAAGEVEVEVDGMASGTEFSFIPDLYFSFSAENHEALPSTEVKENDDASDERSGEAGPESTFTPAPVFHAVQDPDVEQPLRNVDDANAGAQEPVEDPPQQPQPEENLILEQVIPEPSQPMMEHAQPSETIESQQQIALCVPIESRDDVQPAMDHQMQQPVLYHGIKHNQYEQVIEPPTERSTSHQLLATSQPVLKGGVVSSEATLKALVRDYIDHTIDENRRKTCIPRTIDFGDIGGFGLNQYNPNFPPSFEEYQRVISPVPIRDDFPTPLFVRFIQSRGFSLPESWENLIRSKNRWEHLYNLGAMQVYVRHVNPNALRDPRDEPIYTELMDINDLYQSYNRDFSKKPLLAITASSHNQADDDDKCMNALELSECSFQGPPLITKPTAPRPLKPTLDKKQQADMMERPPPPKFMKHSYRDKSGRRFESSSRSTTPDCVIIPSSPPPPRKVSQNVKIGEDFVIIGNQIFDLCKESDNGFLVREEEDEEDLASSKNSVDAVSQRESRRGKKKKGIRDEPIEFKREASCTNIATRALSVPKQGKSSLDLNPSIIRNLDRIICQVKAQRKDQLSTRMKGGEFGFISLGVIRNPPKGSEKVLTHRFNMERKYAEKRKRECRVEVKIEVDRGTEVVVLSPNSKSADEGPEDDRQDEVLSETSKGKQPRRRGPAANKGRKVIDDPFTREASASLKRALRKRIDQVDYQKREAKTGGKNYNSAGTYMAYDDRDSDSESDYDYDDEIAPSKTRKRKRATCRVVSSSDEEEYRLPDDEELDSENTKPNKDQDDDDESDPESLSEYVRSEHERILKEIRAKMGKSPPGKILKSTEEGVKVYRGKPRGRKKKDSMDAPDPTASQDADEKATSPGAMSPILDPEVIDVVEDMLKLVALGIEKYESVVRETGKKSPDAKTPDVPVFQAPPPPPDSVPVPIKRPVGRPRKKPIATPSDASPGGATAGRKPKPPSRGKKSRRSKV